MGFPGKLEPFIRHLRNQADNHPQGVDDARALSHEGRFSHSRTSSSSRPRSRLRVLRCGRAGKCRLHQAHRGPRAQSHPRSIRLVGDVNSDWPISRRKPRRAAATVIPCRWSSRGTCSSRTTSGEGGRDERNDRLWAGTLSVSRAVDRSGGRTSSPMLTRWSGGRSPLIGTPTRSWRSCARRMPPGWNT